MLSIINNIIRAEYCDLLAHRETTSRILSGPLGRITALRAFFMNSLVPFSLFSSTRGVNLVHRVSEDERPLDRGCQGGATQIAETYQDLPHPPSLVLVVDFSLFLSICVLWLYWI